MPEALTVPGAAQRPPSDAAAPNAVTLPPGWCDVEAAVAEVLRTGLATVPVFGRLPNERVWPCVQVRRIAGAPMNTRPLYLDAAIVQVDAFALSKSDARQLADQCRLLLARAADVSTAHGRLATCRLGSMSYQPADEYTPPVEHYRQDVTAYGRLSTPAQP
jgi:hypothetical protein